MPSSARPVDNEKPPGDDVALPSAVERSRVGRWWHGASRSAWALRLLFATFRNYIRHQSANQAGSIAFSSVLSMFPLLILVSAAAAFIGEPGEAVSLARRVLSFAPPLVHDSLKPVVDQVLGQRSEALLALGIIVTIWTASSGMQAVWTALNKAYGVEHGLSFWMARVKVTLFTVIVGGGILAAFSSVVIMPYVFQALRDYAGNSTFLPWLHDSVRYAMAFVALAVMYALLYAWLPDIRQQTRTVVPGALFGALLWVMAAALLSHTLRSTAKLMLVYGSFAGVVATLVFLYVSAVTMILGAELNAVLRPSEAGDVEARRPGTGMKQNRPDAS